jgi:hypothetical protein
VIENLQAVERARRFLDAPAEDVFEEVALEVFRFQFTHNAPYRRLCEHRHRTPDHVARWEEIPLVPAAAFKETVLTCAEPRHRFRTSGTTRGPQKRGGHHLPTLELYEASWPGPFRRALLPDRERMETGSLIPAWEALPESSLAYMATGVLERFATPESRTFMSADGLDAPGLESFLVRASDRGEPLLLLGTALALAAFLEALPRQVPLPPGSRIMDTGGFKGRRREVHRDELLALYEGRLGVPPTHVVGEYGMTELSSQLYEDTLARHAGGDPARPRRYQGPRWMRTRVLDPETLDGLPPGNRGLLAHLDLANAWTVAGVITEDLGVELPDGGFRILGRAEGSELRGCSLATEALMEE